MLNFKYRYAVRHRPSQFRQFGRASWVKRAGMSRPRKPKASRLAIGSSNNYIKPKIFVGEGNLRKRKREVDYNDFGYKTSKLAVSLGAVGRGIYSYAKRKINRRYGIDDPTDVKVDWLDIV